jgi:hypothetical protein
MTLLLLLSIFSFQRPAGDNLPPPTPSSDASFSCLIDGTPFSSNGSDGMANAAFKTAKDIISFTLASMDAKYKGKNKIPPQFQFTVASSGTCHFNSENVGAKYTAKYTPADYIDGYNAESGSATITSITASHISGTFSGIFSGMGKTFKVTEGKFDLPASKYTPSLL